jgi:hypothetical protein
MMERIILITRAKNPKLYKALLRKGGTVKFNSVIMTIKRPHKTLIENLAFKLKSILK